ncbi:MAG: phospholipase D-like domain-containing protein [Xanthomonadales bacterium]|jgi:phosphatidylserine/phosphatidylglycerophosphate/cardiolipin synthase-like enzyme|nr:phospholipase D-like domain-containing protein [Xanthomonadales bacterium]
MHTDPRLSWIHRRLFTGALLASLFALLSACATAPGPDACPAGTCPPAGAEPDPFIADLYDKRRWAPGRKLKELGIDPVRYASEAQIPVSAAEAKILGPTPEEARQSMAAKIWMIENARHTIDAVYYIFRPDLSGQAFMAALCEAIKRGVDVRLMVDGAGSLSTSDLALNWLQLCEAEAGWMVSADGVPTDRRARVEVVIFNALTDLSASPNRRSHDKLLLTDAAFPGQALMMTGGRNIALDYYGFTADGELDPGAYQDSEILFRSLPDEDGDLGEVSQTYFSLLFLFRGNKRLSKREPTDRVLEVFRKHREDAYRALRDLRRMPIMQPHFREMDQWMNEGFIAADALLAHNMANLDNRGVVRNVAENFERNPNSILYVLNRIGENPTGEEDTDIVSPYLFLARYEDRDGKLILDEAEAIRAYLDEHPRASFELITNSVLTSDNIFAQAVIDFDTAPRLLLPPELQEQWLALKHDEEATAELVHSEAWQAAVNQPRIAVWQSGGLDSSKIGGDTVYGKLHAKFWLENEIGFVGTDNFDYRSRLYNSEMGYFFRAPLLVQALREDVDLLKSKSVRWGTPEWLELRQRAGAMDGMKGASVRNQRPLYRTLRTTGLQWLF